MRDRATAESLKPWYSQFCKRPCFHDQYLQTFNRDNVTLVDTRGLGVQRIDATGVVVDDVLYELDCLIFATGFEVGTDYRRRTGFEVVGRDGIALTDDWSDGVRTFQGLTVRGLSVLPSPRRPWRPRSPSPGSFDQNQDSGMMTMSPGYIGAFALMSPSFSRSSSRNCSTSRLPSKLRTTSIKASRPWE